MALDAGCAAVCDTESDAVLDAAAAAVAAVKALGADDPYGRSLSEWFVVIDDLADSDEQLPEPPKLDIRGLLDVLRTQRQAAHDAALACWRVLRGESVASIVASDRNTEATDATASWPARGLVGKRKRTKLSRGARKANKAAKDADGGYTNKSRTDYRAAGNPLVTGNKRNCLACSVLSLAPPSLSAKITLPQLEALAPGSDLNTSFNAVDTFLQKEAKWSLLRVSSEFQTRVRRTWRYFSGPLQLCDLLAIAPFYLDIVITQVRSRATSRDWSPTISRHLPPSLATSRLLSPSHALPRLLASSRRSPTAAPRRASSPSSASSA